MFLVIPTLPLLLALAAYAKSVSLPEVALMLSIFSWPFPARVIRSQVLSLRERPYVELAKLSKESDFTIIFQQLLPNLLPYIGVGFASAALGAIFALVGLEVIGLGPTSTMDLGLLINLAINWGVLTMGAWTIFVAPIVLLVLLFLSLNLMNLGLEEFFNPRLRRLTGE
jgi:peptide/nickel transport system permease protein